MSWGHHFSHLLFETQVIIPFCIIVPLGPTRCYSRDRFGPVKPEKKKLETLCRCYSDNRWSWQTKRGTSYYKEQAEVQHWYELQKNRDKYEAHTEEEYAEERDADCRDCGWKARQVLR